MNRMRGECQKIVWAFLSLFVLQTVHADSVVVFNEVMYNAGPGVVQEWVELYNQQAIDVDISRWSIQGGFEYAFPEGTFIAGRGYLVVALVPDMETFDGLSGIVHGPFHGRLSNAGETLRLINNSGRTMDVLEYGDRGEWPVAPDGSGVSLAKRHVNLPSGAASHWTWSRQIAGTPGLFNFDPEAIPAPTPNSVVRTVRVFQAAAVTAWPTLAFNEVQGLDPMLFWVELVNYGSKAIQLEDLALVCTGDVGSYYRLGREVLLPGAYLVIGEVELGFRPKDEKLFLYSADRASILDAVRVDASHRGRRTPGLGPWCYPSLVTPGFVNQFDFNRDIVINEIFYHGPESPESADLYEPRSLLTPGAAALTLVPQDDVLGTDWTGGDSGFDDTAWTHGVGGTTGVGYELGIGYEGDIGTDIAAQMLGKARSVYIRIPFDVAQTAVVDAMTLNMKYDDGFVAYLNGQEVARANAPAVLGADAFATAGHEADSFEPFEVTRFQDSLRVGRNILAIHGLNRTVNSSDLLFLPELVVLQAVSPHREAASSAEEWIELYNRGTGPVDLSGWRMDRGIRYEFTAGTVMRPAEHLVIARDSQWLADQYPDVRIVGDYTGKLSNSGERLGLVDARGNPVDELHYYDDAPWPAYADGHGASLELRDPQSDNAHVSAWCASDQGARSTWKTYVYRGIAQSSAVGPDGQWQEFVLGLLDAGEVLLDDISVVEAPDGAARPLIQNSNFESGTPDTWRLLGNHRHSEVVVDPDNPNNHVLHLKATGPTGHMHNHAETTLAQNRSIGNGREYEISFRAKWIGGSNQLNTRLYFNRLARTTLIDVPAQHGTPGRINTCLENMGPVLQDLHHVPAVPLANESVAVSVRVQDPDGIDTVTLWWRVDGATWQPGVTSRQGDRVSATLPGQAAGTVVQFYVEALDLLGNRTTMPAAGPESRALYRVNDELASWSGLHNVRIVMAAEDYDWMSTDIHIMSNDRFGATVIYDESTVFYDVGVRLKSSQRHRHVASEVGFNLKFPADNLFRGVHKTVAIDRSEGIGPGQREMLIHQAMNHAGGALSKYSDMIHVIAPRQAHTGTAELQMARFGSVYLDEQFRRGSDGTVYEQEYIYYPYTTKNGDPEGFKRPQPDRVTSTAIRSLGEDKEPYRWAYLIKNNRRQDDFASIINLAEHFDSAAAVFQRDLDQVIDVDQWLASFAVAVANGAGDNYGMGGPHNAQFYVRPEDGRILYFPHDIDAFYQWNRALVANSDLSRMLAVPAYERLYYGHVHHLLTSSYNAAYMSHWTTLFKEMAPHQSFEQHLSFIDQRSRFLSQEIDKRVASPYPFRITQAVRTQTGNAVIAAGLAWIEVKDIFLAGADTPLACTWSRSGSGASRVFTWEATIGLSGEETLLTCTAVDFKQVLIATETIPVAEFPGN
ncbi:MAG: lamin tail domain-containing protein [Phycisphaeraceae bacterium]|nr:lamin tail domain-containing protein [Phycisphaeraceae bacterium]